MRCLNDHEYSAGRPVAGCADCAEMEALVLNLRAALAPLKAALSDFRREFVKPFRFLLGRR